MLDWRCVLLLSLCCGALMAQTFQYSRGWTNGRKRSGPSGNLCGRLQHQKFLLFLTGRAIPELLAECGGWLGPDVAATVEDYGAMIRGGSESANHDGVRSDLEVSPA